MKAWVVRKRGNPWDVFTVEDDFPEPSHEALQAMSWGLEGLRPRAEGEPPIGEYVIIRPSVATLAWPDVTMATGAYPVEVAMPYVSGQEDRIRWHTESKSAHDPDASAGRSTATAHTAPGHSTSKRSAES